MEEEGRNQNERQKNSILKIKIGREAQYSVREENAEFIGIE